jgi:lysophospholipid acyltransferase (LPLAT)-like uncharacterized protein
MAGEWNSTPKFRKGGQKSSKQCSRKDRHMVQIWHAKLILDPLIFLEYESFASFSAY